jgi:hypothetical protein
MQGERAAIHKIWRVLCHWRDESTPLAVHGGGLPGQFGFIIRGHLVGVTPYRIAFNTGTEIQLYDPQLEDGPNGPRLLLQMRGGEIVTLKPIGEQLNKRTIKHG